MKDILKAAIGNEIRNRYPRTAVKDVYGQLYDSIINVVSETVLQRGKFTIEDGKLGIQGQPSEPAPRSEIDRINQRARIRLTRQSVDDVVFGALLDEGFFHLLK